MDPKSFSTLKFEIQKRSKNGVDFILAAAIIWLCISYIWTMDYSAYNLSVLTFIVGAALLPLALLFSKLLKTRWKLEDNPLNPLGLWLNFAQLLYFPFLIFILVRYPEYFIMAYAIITGAHLFPYGWYYDEIGYVILAVLIPTGSLLITLNISAEEIWQVPLFTTAMFLLLAVWIYARWRSRFGAQR